MDEERLITGHLEDFEPGEDPWIGKVLGERYRVLHKLGGGGMGSVYEAEHTIIGRHVAIKVLHSQFGADKEAVRRFMNEARAAAMLGHPNILHSTDMGRADDGSPFVVLELLRGNDLSDEVKQGGALRVGRAVGIALQVCAGLGAAHAKGIIHRDVKPGNVFLTKSEDGKDHIKVLDFGISKFTGSLLSGASTSTGAMLGTPHFMAPEQLRDSSKVDVRVDVYAVGCVLYVMLTANLPFSGSETLLDLALRIMSEEAIPIDSYRGDIPKELEAVIRRAMAKEADERFSSVAELADAIRPFENHDAAPVLQQRQNQSAGEATTRASGRGAVEAAPPERSPSSFRRSRWLIAAVAGLLLVWGAVVVYGLSGEDPVPDAVLGAATTPVAVDMPDAGTVLVALAPRADAAPPDPAVAEDAGSRDTPDAAAPETVARVGGRRIRRVPTPPTKMAQTQAHTEPRPTPPPPRVEATVRPLSCPGGTTNNRYTGDELRRACSAVAGRAAQCRATRQLTHNYWRVQVDASGRVATAVPMATSRPAQPTEITCMGRVVRSMRFQGPPQGGPGEMLVQFGR